MFLLIQNIDKPFDFQLSPQGHRSFFNLQSEVSPLDATKSLLDLKIWSTHEKRETEANQILHNSSLDRALIEQYRSIPTEV